MLASLPDDRGINDRHHLRQMAVDQMIEKRFVRVLKISQVSMFVDVGLEGAELAVGAGRLLFDGLDRLGNEAVQLQARSLVARKGTPLVEQGDIEERGASVRDGDRAFYFVSRIHQRSSQSLSPRKIKSLERLNEGSAQLILAKSSSIFERPRKSRL